MDGWMVRWMDGSWMDAWILNINLSYYCQNNDCTCTYVLSLNNASKFYLYLAILACTRS